MKFDSFMKFKEFLHFKKNKYGVRTIAKWLWNAWRGNQMQAVINAVIGILEVVVSLVSVWAMKYTIDIAAGHTKGSIYLAVGFMAFLIVCDMALHICSIWVKNILGIRAQNRMQQQLFDRLLRSEWHGKEIHHSGDVLNRLEIDVNTVVNFLTEVIPNTLSVICLFIGSFGILFQMDASLAIITVGILPVFVLLSRLYIGKMRNLTRLVRDCESHVQSIIQETIQHRMLIKTLECDDTMVNKLEERQSTLREKVRNRTIFSIFSQLMLNVGFSAGYIIAFLWSALRLYQKVITFGDMMAFLQLVYRIQGPARDLTRLAPAFVGVFTAAERLMELDETPQEEQGTPIRFKALAGIRLKDVRYSYDGNSKIVLDNMSYDFTPGSCTAILGETGAGKTTIIRLLLALIHPISGQVELYNAKRNLPISPRMRCNLIYVPQGNTLLSGTIRENLYLGKLYATDDELKEVLHLACADFVYDLPDGLETRCGEGGGGLSEGQAQRIAIARALLREGNILLLDEATSALDMETERELLSKVFNKENQKTVIFVTHRPAVIDYCDNVLHLGTHD